MNRTDLTKEIARREALASAWSASAKELRTELELAARREFEDNGTGVTWTMRDLGRVTLPLSTEAPVIADIDALLKWCKERHPDNVQTVEQVRVAYQTWLLGNVVCDNGVAVHPETGEIIPGLAVREGGKPKTLTITFDRSVKDVYASYAAAVVAEEIAAEPT